MRRIRLLAVTSVLLLAVWFGLKEGLDGFRDAESGSQRIAAALQIAYGVSAVASLWGLLSHRPWLRWVLALWVLTITATGTLAPVAWGGASWSAAVLGGGATALVSGLVAWGAWLHDKPAPGASLGLAHQREPGQ